MERLRTVRLVRVSDDVGGRPGDVGRRALELARSCAARPEGVPALQRPGGVAVRHRPVFRAQRLARPSITAPSRLLRTSHRFFHHSWWRTGNVVGLDQRGYPTLSPVSTGMGDRVRTLFRYVTDHLGRLSLLLSVER